MTKATQETGEGVMSREEPKRRVFTVEYDPRGPGGTRLWGVYATFEGAVVGLEECSLTRYEAVGDDARIVAYAPEGWQVGRSAVQQALIGVQREARERAEEKAQQRKPS